MSPRNKKHRTFRMPAKTRRNFRTHLEILNSARQSLDDKGQFEWLKGAKVFGEDPRHPGRFPQEVLSSRPTEAALNRSTRSCTFLTLARVNRIAEPSRECSSLGWGGLDRPDADRTVSPPDGSPEHRRKRRPPTGHRRAAGGDATTTAPPLPDRRATMGGF